MSHETCLSEDVLEKLVAYLERLDGRDAPLSAEDEAMVVDLLENDAEAQRIANEICDINDSLSTFFHDVSDIKVSSPLFSMVEGLSQESILAIDRPKAAPRPPAVNSDDRSNIVDLPRAATPTGSRYGPLAAAASIVAVVSMGTLFHLYTDFEIERTNLATQLKATLHKLDDRDSTLADTEAQLAALDQALADRTASLDQAADGLKQAEALIHDLRVDQEAGEDLNIALAHAERSLVEARQEAVALRGEVGTLNRELANAETERLQATTQMAGLEDDLAASKNWLGQVAQYHRVYASTSRKRLVEAGADERAEIETWLGEMIDRDLVVPDLTEDGITFAGARLLGVNGKPVAQLVYLDGNDQPLALCIIPSDKGETSPESLTDGDLNLVEWRDATHGFALVGWSDPEILDTLTNVVQTTDL